MTAGRTIPPDQAARDAIAQELGVSMLVEASAGTGKTTSMVGRMIELIRSGMAIEHITAITFTKKAAAELQGRFYKALQDRARDKSAPANQRERFTRAVGQIDRCAIGTIHSFCGRLLRERPVEAGVGMNFTELDDDADLQLRHQGWDDFVDTCFCGESDLPERLDALGLSFGGLRDAFGSFCNYSDVECWPVDEVTLPDGDELTAVLEAFRNRIRLIEPHLANAQAGNDKLLQLYLNPPQTAHLQLDRPEDRLEWFELLSLLPALKPTPTKPFPGKVNKQWPGKKEQAEEQHELWREFHANLVEPALVRLRACRYRLILDMFTTASKHYAAARRAANALSFQDLLLRAAEMLRTCPAVRDYFRQQIRCLLVDEFQDTDPIQAEIMLLLTADDPDEANFRRCRPRAGSLFVVGDPKQSIYRFRRADIQTYNFVRDRIESSGGRVMHLTTNFRSSDAVISWVNARFGPEGEFFHAAADGAQAAPDTMHTGKPEADLPARADIHSMATIPDGIDNGQTKFNPAAIELDARRIAAVIDHAVETGAQIVDFAADGSPQLRPVRHGDFLILTKTTTHLAAYANALLARNIPAQVTGGSQLNEIPELELLARALGAIAEPDNPIALVAALRSGLFGLDDDTLLRFRRAGGCFDYRVNPPTTLPAELHEQFALPFAKLRTYTAWLDEQRPPVVVAEAMLDDLGLLLRSGCRSGALGTLGGLARAIELLRHRQRQSVTASALAEMLAEIIAKRIKFDVIPAAASDHAPVRVMNLHKAKGLEAPVVFLAAPRGQISHAPKLHIDRTGDVARGYMTFHGKSFGPVRGGLLACPADWPDHALAEQTFLDAEAERLLYVAATRAGRALIVSTRPKPASSNPWNAFHDALADAPPLVLPTDCDLAPQPDDESAAPIEFDFLASQATLDAKKTALSQPTYAVRSAKADALKNAYPTHRFDDTESLGAAWGTAVHQLLESAMRQPAIPLDIAANNAITAAGLEDALADSLVQTVRSVIASPLWQRALDAEERHSEIPFEIALDADGADVLRGVIDLLYRDENGWTIVDYKTDAGAKSGRDALAEYYRPQLDSYAAVWETLTGQPVYRKVIFFTATGDEVDV